METDRTKSRLTALQLVGSPTSAFYFELSLLYARPVVRPAGFDLLFLVAYPTGDWSLGAELTETGERYSLAEILPKLSGVDLVVPHLFCPRGLTAYRSFFEEVLGLPLVGSPGSVLSVAQKKQLTRLVATSAGLRVAPGLLVDATDPAAARRITNELPFPLIVKPDESDNSDGLSLVRRAEDLARALVQAREYGKQVVAEAYIPGREIRGAVVEINGKLRVLPFIEYLVSEAYPIRQAQDKLKTDDEGHVTGQSGKERIPAMCPADIAEPLATELGRMMRRMHRALGCRDFSLFDFRVHAETGEPYLLEAGLFWSFGEISMVSSMLEAGGRDLREVTRQIWTAAAAR